MSTKASVVDFRLAGIATGFRLPKVELSLSFMSGFYIQLRHNSVINTYGITSFIDVDQGCFMIAGVGTDWFPVSYSWSQNAPPDGLAGKLVDLEIKAGVVLGPLGDIDVKMTVYSSTNQPLFSLEVVEVEAEGIMILDSKIRGRLVRLGDKNHPAR